jgi:hypothetical protein
MQNTSNEVTHLEQDQTSKYNNQDKARIVTTRDADRDRDGADK